MPLLFFAGKDNVTLVNPDDDRIIRWQETKKPSGRGRRHFYKIQDKLFQLGQFVQAHSILVCAIVFSFFTFCCIGLQYVQIETDIVKLWVSEGGRLNEELKYFKTVRNRYGTRPWVPYDENHFVAEPVDHKQRLLQEDEASNSGYQVLIQTAEHADENLLTKEGLLRHVKLLEYIVSLEVPFGGLNWTLADICFKPGALDIPPESVAYSLKPVLERLVPCVWITPIDCYFEGSKPLGPYPPIRVKDVPMGELLRFAIPGLPDENSWSTINPASIVKALQNNFDLGTMANFFSRTGIDEGYLNRPCIDPLDPACPPQAPNYYHTCKGINRLARHLSAQNSSIDHLLGAEKPKAVETSIYDIFGSLMTSSGNKTETSNTSKADEGKKFCDKYRKSFLQWVGANTASAAAILGVAGMPRYPEYGNVMRKGCNGFAKEVMNWPVDMILGGLRDNGRNVTAEALQSVLLVASSSDIYMRYKGSERVAAMIAASNASSADTFDWSPIAAADVIKLWQRKFTSAIYNHDFNFVQSVSNPDERVMRRTVHPLAAASISDILAEYCDFNYQIILLGYMLMIVYAVYSQVRCDNCLLSANSSVGLSLAGVITVTFASIAGLGFVTWFGVQFNAATTQIIPFLTLGIGVDNMFMLLHNYPIVLRTAKRDEIGMLMRETGMSILLTSVNNILSFTTGIILPIPALRSFCTQASVLLTFNLIAIMSVYPALISLDLRRRKSGRRDVCCCMTTFDDSDNESLDSYGFDLRMPLSPPPVQSKAQYQGLVAVDKEEDELHDHVHPWSLHAFIRKYYVPMLLKPYAKALIIALCAIMFTASIFGIQRSTIGLELSDVLPADTAPAAFLRARDEYFSFYPMFIILRSEDVDFAQKQTEIEHLRNEIARSRFIVKLDNGEPSERYWLGLFREWLRGLQAKLDVAKAAGILENFDANNHTKPPDLRIAYSLACSYGELYDCSRAGRIRLVDESGTINTEGFYNYLYGWHEYELAFYTVSQAAFYPPLHKLRQGDPDKYRYFVPPAPKPVYSQIPFYLTGLKTTAITVEMIKEIRAICNNYTLAGVPNHPSGIAFTFWEQYLDLNYNLVVAISVISCAVFIVVSLMLFSPWAAACILLILLTMTVELAGFLGFCGIKLNPVSAVSLITAVGIGVEFTAHIVFAFIQAAGTRNERMAAAVDQVFVPVMIKYRNVAGLQNKYLLDIVRNLQHGGLSTLLGIIMLGFSEFEFVVKYFFFIMSALIIIGLVNGLLLLPVALSLIGPPSKIGVRSPSQDVT